MAVRELPAVLDTTPEGNLAYWERQVAIYRDIVDRQIATVAYWRKNGPPQQAEKSEALLAEFRGTLARHIARVAELEAVTEPPIDHGATQTHVESVSRDALDAADTEAMVLESIDAAPARQEVSNGESL